MKLLNRVTFDQVLNSANETIFYSAGSLWWTDDPADLLITKPLPARFRPPGAEESCGAGLPCDPNGCVLMEMAKQTFLGDVQRIISHYGSVEVLMAMHAKNFEPEEGDPLAMFSKKETFINAVKAATGPIPESHD